MRLSSQTPGVRYDVKEARTVAQAHGEYGGMLSPCGVDTLESNGEQESITGGELSLARS